MQVHVGVCANERARREATEESESFFGMNL